MARAYEALKRELARKHSAADFAARHAYAGAKGEFITRITEQALAAGYPNGE